LTIVASEARSADTRVFVVLGIVDTSSTVLARVGVASTAEVVDTVGHRRTSHVAARTTEAGRATTSVRNTAIRAPRVEASATIETRVGVTGVKKDERTVRKREWFKTTAKMTQQTKEIEVRRK
jgi:hypothetical protein